MIKQIRSSKRIEISKNSNRIANQGMISNRIANQGMISNRIANQGMISKKGLSTVVATVLLVLITVVAVSIIAYIIIPTIKDYLYGSTDCFKTVDKIKLMDACYNSTDKTSAVTISLGNDVTIRGIAIIVHRNSESKRMDIFNGTTLSGLIKMSNGSTMLYLPGEGETRTYLVNYTSASSIEVAPIIEKKTCDPVDSIDIGPC